MERDDGMRSIEVPRDGSSTVNNPLKAAVDAEINHAEHQPLPCTFVPDSAVVQGNVAQWLTFQEARVLQLTNRQNCRAMAARVSPEGFSMEMYEEVITALGLPVEQFMREFPFVPKVTPPIPGIIALRRTKDFMNGESHVCIKLQSMKGSVFIVSLKDGKIDGCKIGIIGPRDEEPEKDHEDCTASFGYPGGFFKTTAHCVRFLRESYAGHQKEISEAASKRNALLHGIE